MLTGHFKGIRVCVSADGASSAGAPAGVQGEGGALQPEGHPLHDGHAAATQLHGLLPALIPVNPTIHPWCRTHPLHQLAQQPDKASSYHSPRKSCCMTDKHAPSRCQESAEKRKKRNKVLLRLSGPAGGAGAVGPGGAPSWGC